MLADLDLLLTAVFCAADDLLPERAKNAKRRVTDAEVIRLCVAQTLMGISSDERFIAVAGKRLGHLFSQTAASASLSQAPSPPSRHDRAARRPVR
jgi:hypothetical protein